MKFVTSYRCTKSEIKRKLLNIPSQYSLHHSWHHTVCSTCPPFASTEALSWSRRSLRTLLGPYLCLDVPLLRSSSRACTIQTFSIFFQELSLSSVAFNQVEILYKCFIFSVKTTEETLFHFLSLHGSHLTVITNITIPKICDTVS